VSHVGNVGSVGLEPLLSRGFVALRLFRLGERSEDVGTRFPVGEFGALNGLGRRHVVDSFALASDSGGVGVDDLGGGHTTDAAADFGGNVKTVLFTFGAKFGKVLLDSFPGQSWKSVTARLEFDGNVVPRNVDVGVGADLIDVEQETLILGGCCVVSIAQVRREREAAHRPSA